MNTQDLEDSAQRAVITRDWFAIVAVLCLLYVRVLRARPDLLEKVPPRYRWALPLSLAFGGALGDAWVSGSSPLAAFVVACGALTVALTVLTPGLPGKEKTDGSLDS